jgi:hypothetical protein
MEGQWKPLPPEKARPGYRVTTAPEGDGFPATGDKNRNFAMASIFLTYLEEQHARKYEITVEWNKTQTRDMNLSGLSLV